MINEKTTSAIEAMLNDNRVQFGDVVNDILQAKILAALEAKRQEVGQNFLADPIDDTEETEEEPIEEDSRSDKGDLHIITATTSHKVGTNVTRAQAGALIRKHRADTMNHGAADQFDAHFHSKSGDVHNFNFKKRKFEKLDENSETLDEVSRDKLLRYIDKAGKERGDAIARHNSINTHMYVHGRSKELENIADKEKAHYDKRNKGTSLALGKASNGITGSKPKINGTN